MRFARRTKDDGSAGRPADHLRGVADQIYFETLERARLFSFVALGIQAFFAVAFDYVQFQAGRWAESPYYLYGVLWRAASVAGFLAYLGLYAAIRPRAADGVRRAHRALAAAYLVFFTLVGASQAVLNQLIAADVSIFVLCICAVATVFHIPGRARWLMYVGGLLLVAAGTVAMGHPPQVTQGLIADATGAVVAVFFLERVTFRYQFGSYADRAAVVEKNQALEATLGALRKAQSELQVAYTRKSRELESARNLQLSMLPREVPEHPLVDFAVHMKPAAEVGGDYYDFHVAADGSISFAIGDATGHGLHAGAMVTATKSLFALLVDKQDIADVLRRGNATLRRVHLPKLFMALAVGRLRDRTLELAGAGMPPALVYRARTGDVEEISLKGLPLGAFTDARYTKTTIELDPGDTVVLMSDGFPESFTADGRMLGYDRAAATLAEIGALTPGEIVGYLDAVAQSWSHGSTRLDDTTFIVLQARASVDAPQPGPRSAERSYALPLAGNAA